jgi:hypothetical protein
VGFDWRPGTGAVVHRQRTRLSGDNAPRRGSIRPRGRAPWLPHCRRRRLGSRNTQATLVPSSRRRCSSRPVMLWCSVLLQADVSGRYRGQIFIVALALGRGAPVGYRVSLVRLDGNRAVSYEPFATGWLQDETYGDGRWTTVCPTVRFSCRMITRTRSGSLGRVTGDKGTLTWFASCRAQLSPQVQGPGKTLHGRASFRAPRRGGSDQFLLGFPILLLNQGELWLPRDDSANAVFVMTYLKNG